MQNNGGAKPELSQADNLDVYIILAGYREWQIKQGDGPSSDLSDFKMVDNMRPAGPVSTERCIDLIDKSLNGSIDFDRLSPDQQQRARETLEKMGLEDFLDDGEISQEELLYAGAEVGKALLEKDPERYSPSEEAVAAASRLLESRGIEDSDGSMARGVAASVERFTQRVNEGLGFDSPRTELEHNVEQAANVTLQHSPAGP